MTKIEDPDPLVRGMDPRIRIHTIMSWIRNTANNQLQYIRYGTLTSTCQCHLKLLLLIFGTFYAGSDPSVRKRLTLMFQMKITTVIYNFLQTFVKTR